MGAEVGSFEPPPPLKGESKNVNGEASKVIFIILSTYDLKILLFFSICVYLLPGLIIGRSHATLQLFKKGSIEQNFRAKLWLYGFDSFFWKVLIEFLFVVFLLFFLNLRKIE